MTFTYKGLVLEPYKHAEFGNHCQYWAVREVKTGLNVTREHSKAPRRRYNAIEEAKDILSTKTARECKEAVKTALNA